jgi:RimJ/RimL family protein N-acetyltransferase
MKVFKGKLTDLECIQDYQAIVRSEFASLKSIVVYDELVAHSIRLPEKNGYLLCVSELHVGDKLLIESLAKWREEATTFHNKFNITFESTQRWLRKLLLDVPDRILFLVLNRYGHPIGHMGFANALNDEGLMEFDNVIRGVRGQDAGLMGLATKTLLTWAQDTFKPNRFYLRTLDDNEHAISFYTKLGFKLDGKQPLRRIECNGEINHLPIADGDTNPPDRYFTCMRLDPSESELFSKLIKS